MLCVLIIYLEETYFTKLSLSYLHKFIIEYMFSTDLHTLAINFIIKNFQNYQKFKKFCQLACYIICCFKTYSFSIILVYIIN